MTKQINILLFGLLFIAVQKINGQNQQNIDKDLTLILENCSIVYLDNEKSTIENGTIVIDKGIIIEIGKLKDYKQYKNIKVINLDGKYVLPGLIDSHIHLATVPEKGRHENNVFMEEQLSEMFYSGITTVRDMAGNGVILADYKRASERNQIPAPEIFYAAQFAGPEYLNEIRSYSSDPHDKTDKPWEQTITDTTNMPLAIARAIGAGVTGIKIYADLTPELVTKITREAHKQGIQAWSHAAVFPASPYSIAEAKVNSMSHAWDIMYGLKDEHHITRNSLVDEIDYKQLDKLLLLMKENDVILDATNYIAENNNLTKGVKVTKRAHELGVKVSVGTDWPVLLEPKYPLYKELDLLIEKCGFTSQQALYSATKIGAESIGLDDRGVIEVGKRADLIITNKNPLKDIKNVYSPYLVIKQGNLYEPTAL